MRCGKRHLANEITVQVYSAFKTPTTQISNILFVIGKLVSSFFLYSVRVPRTTAAQYNNNTSNSTHRGAPRCSAHHHYPSNMMRWYETTCNLQLANEIIVCVFSASTTVPTTQISYLSFATWSVIFFISESAQAHCGVLGLGSAPNSTVAFVSPC
jgi:hypothetical protein